MKLELKHLTPYLIYKLSILQESKINSKEPNICELKSIDTCVNMINFGHGNALELHEFKPILRPLSDLTKEEKEQLSIYPMEIKDIKIIPYPIMLKLFEWHIDVFGLIEQNLAIDSNTLKS